MNKLFISGVFLFFSIYLIAQNQHPPNIKWIKTETPHFNVIAPEGLLKQLTETANMMEHVHYPVSKSLCKPEKKLNLFIFNQTVLSNGYVALAPTYSAYYHTPFQEANAVGGSDWFQTLSLHEYRHYIQFSKLNTGFTYVASSVFGDYGQAVAMNWSVPAWFFEGDAICSETALSAGGRGRLPSFTRDIRALELENKRYTYDKSYLGSYKDYFPNHYYLGYLMSSGIRKRYGIKAWNNILTRSAKKSFWPFAFGGSLGKYADGRMGRSFRYVLNEYDSVWTAKADNQLTTHFDIIKPYKKVYTNYKYPFSIGEGAIICLKSGLASPQKLTIISESTEYELLQISPVDRIHSNGEIVSWAAYNSDIRWGQKSFTDIIVYDIERQTLQKVSKKQKYFAPAISPNGEKIAVVEYTERMECSIVIINSKTGDIIRKYPIEHNYFVRMPSWSEKEDKLVFTMTYGQNISISVLDIKTSNIKNIVPASPLNITSPIFFNEFILYNSPELGVDAIVAIDTLTKEKYVVVSSKYGAYEVSASANNQQFVFQNYSTKGFNIGELEVFPKEWLSISEFENIHDKYYEYIVEQERDGNIFENYVPDSIQHYNVKKYKSFLHSIKVHSWAPYPVNNGVGFSVYSNDYLNTTSAVAGAEYHPNSSTGRGFLNINYAKFFPIFDAGISYGRRYEAFEDTVNNTNKTGLNEKSIRFGVSVPLDFSHRVWQTKLVLNSSYNYIDQNYYEANPDNSITPNNVSFSAMDLGVVFSNYKQSSRRDINPIFGQEFRFNTWLTPFDDETNGSRQSIVGKVYLPGFLIHHSLELEAAHERNSNDFSGGIYTLGTDIEFVRGYKKPIADYYYNVKAIYTLPLFYPDWAIGPLAYIKRIHASVFYDFGRTYRIANDVTSYYNSVGVDFNFDFHIFRILQVPLRMGMRCSYLVEKDMILIQPVVAGIAF